MAMTTRDNNDNCIWGHPPLPLSTKPKVLIVHRHATSTTKCPCALTHLRPQPRPPLGDQQHPPLPPPTRESPGIVQKRAMPSSFMGRSGHDPPAVTTMTATGGHHKHPTVNRAQWPQRCVRARSRCYSAFTFQPRHDGQGQTLSGRLCSCSATIGRG